jgi:hypothetical protein
MSQPIQIVAYDPEWPILFDRLQGLALRRGAGALLKGAAGEWALRRDPRLAVVRDALDQRYRDPGQGIDAAQVQALLMLVRGRVARAREAGPSTRPPSALR